MPNKFKKSEQQTNPMELSPLADLIVKGDHLAAAKLMREVDDEVPAAQKILKELYSRTGRAHIVGVTGPPGSGKSTIIDELIRAVRKENRSIGVVAIDPTSPFSDGAILGDRIRMLRHCSDKQVFIRSVATRGYMGGLSRSTHDIVDIMDAMGKDIIIVETVGVGQDEVDVMRLVDTNIVVQVPGMGDTIQSIKAGVLEIGDIFVINKADLPGSEATFNDISIMLESRPNPGKEWQPPVVKTVATEDYGISELLAIINRHRSYLDKDLWEQSKRRRRREKFDQILRDVLFREVIDKLERNQLCPGLIDSLDKEVIDPYSAAESVLKELIADTKGWPRKPS